MLLLGYIYIYYMYIYRNIIYVHVKKGRLPKSFHPLPSALLKVTLVAMLSTSNAYVGGRSCFRRAQGSRGHRELTLEQGDVVSWLQLKQGLVTHGLHHFPPSVPGIR